MSRFDALPIDVMAPEEDDKFAPGERGKRRLALSLDRTFPSSVNEMPEGTPVEERRQHHQRWLEANDLLPEDEARTDAAASVIYESEDGRWQVRWVLAEQFGSVVPRAVTLEPTGRTTPSGGVTTNLLRELRPGRAVSDAAEALAGDPHGPHAADEEIGRVFIRLARRDIERAGIPREQPRRTGRPPLSDDHLASVAIAYLEELQRGRGVLRRLGDRFGRTQEAMRDQVRIARRKGFLSPAPKAGRKGATPGPRLAELLSDHEGATSDG